MGVALLPLAQRDQEVLAYFRHILRGMLDYRYLRLGYFLRLFGSKSVRVRLFDLLKNPLQKLRLLVFRFLYLYFLHFSLDFLFLKFALDYFRVVLLLGLLQQFATDFSHHVVIICSVRVVLLQKSKLCIMLLSLQYHFLKLGPIRCYVVGSLLHQFFLLP